MSPQFKTPPPSTKHSLLSYPAPYVLLVTLNRPDDLNCINQVGSAELHAVWNWMDSEPSLRVGIITGKGRAFCAGADLKEWNISNTSPESSPRARLIRNGFGGLSTRSGRKPVIAAVNGICLGGGCEMVVNADLVYASPKAIFGLPEVKVGVVALAGALPRLVRTVGKQRAMELALTGRHIKAKEAERWGMVNKVADDAVGEAVKAASMIAANSPDSVIVSREGIKLGWEGIGAQEGTEKLAEDWFSRMEGKENMIEGVRAFVEKRKPNWVESKL